MKDISIENEQLKKKLHSHKAKYEKIIKDKELELSQMNREKVLELQAQIEDERINTQRALQEMMQCKGFLDNLVRENSEKEKMILKLQKTIDTQEDTIIDIEKELSEVNRFYQQQQIPDPNNINTVITHEIMNLFQIKSVDHVLPCISDFIKKNKLANQFVEKSWKLMTQFNDQENMNQSQPNIKDLWRWVRKVVQDFYDLSKNSGRLKSRTSNE